MGINNYYCKSMQIFTQFVIVFLGIQRFHENTLTEDRTFISSQKQSIEGSQIKWIKLKCDIKRLNYFKVEFRAIHGGSSQGYVAFDDLNFLQTDTCDFEPKTAWPMTTGVSTSTTPIPTEPPHGEQLTLIRTSNNLKF